MSEVTKERYTDLSFTSIGMAICFFIAVFEFGYQVALFQTLSEDPIKMFLSIVIIYTSSIAYFRFMHKEVWWV